MKTIEPKADRLVPPWESAVLAAALLAGLTLRLWTWMHPIRDLFDSGILIDDAYYAMAYAREFARGNPFQVAPGQIGNGFQPLYVFLIAPIFRFVGDDPQAPVRWALLGTTLLNLATAVPLTLWAKRLGAGRAAVLAGALWALSPVVIRESLNGLETTLNLFVLCSIGALWPALLRRPFRLGLICAVAVLARFDNLLLLPFLALLAMANKGGIGLKTKKVRASAIFSPANVRFYLIALAGFAVGLGPYLLASWAYTGHALPISGAGVRMITKLYNQAPPDGQFNNLAVMQNLHYLRKMLKNDLGNHVLPAVAAERTGAAIKVLWGVLALAAAVLIGALRPSLRRIGLYLLFGLLLFHVWAYFYVLWVGGHWFYGRYFHGAVMLVILATALAAGQGRGWSTRGRRAALAVFLLAYAGLSKFALDDYLAEDSWREFDCLPFVKEAVARGERVARFQSGLHGYMTHGAVINLDGVVNRDATEAMREGRMGAYLREQQIDIVVDWPFILGALMFDRMGEPEPKLTRLKNDGYNEAWRIEWPGEETKPAGEKPNEEGEANGGGPS